jgi:uncharacterized membrane protein YdjX (TVP38/TMEM64 family)
MPAVVGNASAKEGALQMTGDFRRSSRPWRFVGVIVIALAIPILPFAVIGELPGERWLSATDDNALLFGATGAGLLAADVLLPIPSTIVGTLLGARLGFFSGWAWSWAGLVVGNLIGYGIGRVALSRFAGDLPRTPTLVAFIASRPVPVLAEAVTFAAGAGGMRWSPFVAASVAANGVLAGVLAGNGAALLPDAMVGPGLILPMALPVIAWLAWQWRTRRRAAASN